MMLVERFREKEESKIFFLMESLFFIQGKIQNFFVCFVFNYGVLVLDGERGLWCLGQLVIGDFRISRYVVICELIKCFRIFQIRFRGYCEMVWLSKELKF